MVQAHHVSFPKKPSFMLGFFLEMRHEEPLNVAPDGLEVKLACEQTGFSLKDEKKPIMSQIFSQTCFSLF
jgi:hypothetical protein